MKKNMTLTALAICATLLLPTGVGAQTAIDESRPADRDARIEIGDIIVGSLRIVGWDRDELQITGQIGRDVDGLEIEGDRAGYEISAEWDDHDWDRDDEDGRRNRRNRRDHAEHRDVAVDLEIRVPYGASLEIDGVTIGVEIENVSGSIDIETVTGEIEYRGEATRIALATVTGSIDVTSPRVERLDVETVQGDIDFTGGFTDGARVSFEAVGGSIALRIPGDSSVSFDIETMTGRIENDFGQEPVRESRWVPSSELRFTLGRGDARVSVETLQGRVEIRRQ